MRIAKLVLLPLLSASFTGLTGCAIQNQSGGATALVHRGPVTASPGKKLLDGDLGNLLNADSKITLERTACYGSCPVYEVVVSGDGQVVFTGYVRDGKKLEYRSTMSQDKLKALFIAFRDIDYFSPMGDSGEDGPSCPSFATDSPSANTSITIGNLSKKVHHYYGCEGSAFLPKLAAFERSLDGIIETDQWVESLRQAEFNITRPACVMPARRIIDPPPNHHPIYFEPHSTKIQGAYKVLLEDDATYFITHTSGDVWISANADARGDESYNLLLSQKRAEAIRKSLILLGVPEVRLHTVSLGNAKPKAPGSDEKSNAENRRVDIMYLGIDYEPQETHPACP